MTLSLSLAIFNSLFTRYTLFSITCTSVTGGLLWTEGSCSGVSTWLRIKAKHVSTRMYLRRVGNLCSNAAYINFFTPFRAAYIQGRLTQSCKRA